MIVGHICHKNKSKKLFCLFFALLFVLAVVSSITAYIYIAFPLDMSEIQCGTFKNDATKVILCRRSGSATVAFHYVVYKDEINPDNVVAIIRDAGTIPKFMHSDKGNEDFVVSISDVNDIVYLTKKAIVCDLHHQGALIKLNIK